MSGKFGTLTKDNFGYMMPVQISPVSRQPYAYRDVELLAITYETDDDEAVKWLPEGLQLASLPARVTITIFNAPFTTVGRYNEVSLTIHTLLDGKLYLFTPSIFVDNDIPMIVGREVYGGAKLLANITWSRQNESISVCCERTPGQPLLAAEMKPTYNHKAEDFDLFSAPGLHLKVIPSPEEGKGHEPEVCELIAIPFQMEPKVGSDGVAEIYTGLGGISFPYYSELYPWHRLRQDKVLSSIYGRFHATLPHGEIVKRY